MGRGKQPTPGKWADRPQEPVRQAQRKPEIGVEFELACRGDQDQSFHTVGILERIFRGDRAAEGMSHQNNFSLHLQQGKSCFQIFDDLGHFIAATRFIGESVSAQVQCNDPVFHQELLHLVVPLFRLTPKPVNEDERPLGVIRRHINCRKPHQRIRRNAHFVTVEVEVNVHAGSLHEAGKDVNFEIQISLRHFQQRPEPRWMGWQAA